MKSLFFCPVYNEIREFPALLDQLRAGAPCDTILLINNGSTDGSEKLVRQSGLPHLDIPQNQGLGYAFVQALDWALEHDYEILGAIAANGKMLPQEMHRVLEPLQQRRADCVGGSRFLPGGDSPNLPRFRRWAIPLASRFAATVVRQPLTDATCGYRAFVTQPFRHCDFDWRARWLWHYGFEPYVYAKFLIAPQLRCVEVPITMAYPPRRHNYSKVPILRGWWSMLQPWLIARFDGKQFS